MHWHVCVDCKRMWRHSDKFKGNEASHTCDGCKCLVWEPVFFTKKNALKALYPSWHHTTDPLGIIPKDWKPNEIIAYISAEGMTPLTLSVKVQAENASRNLVSYISVLFSYFRSIDEQKFLERFTTQPADLTVFYGDTLANYG